MLRGGLGRLVLSTLGRCTNIHTYVCTHLVKLGRPGEAWGMLWAGFGEAWGGLGNVWECFGEDRGGLGTAWGMLCECFGKTWGSTQKSISNPGPPHKQNYDQGVSPQAELRPGRFPTSRIMTREPAHKQNYRNTTRELAGWLAGGITSREPVVHLAGWLAGQRLAGRLAEPQRGPERRTVDTYIEQACHALG